MKQMMILLGLVCISGVSLPAWAEDHGDMAGMMHQHMMQTEASDKRTSLHLPAHMKQQQLTMMREHLAAVNDIIADIAEGKFDAASRTAHQKLGLTPEMQQMCNMFDNDEFRNMGLTFHKRGDALGDALKTKNVRRSLDALHTTINSCVQCHATFRQ